MLDEFSGLRDWLRSVVKDEVRKALDECSAAASAEYLSPREAAEIARVHEGTIRRWIRERRLQKHRAGTRVRIRRDELERVMSPRTTSAKSRGVMLSPEAIAARLFG